MTDNILEDLYNARKLVLERENDVILAKRKFTVAQALAEKQVIDSAGDEKALGANAEARQRAMTLALEHNRLFVTARDDLDNAMLELDDAKLKLEILFDARRFYEYEQRERMLSAGLVIPS